MKLSESESRDIDDYLDGHLKEEKLTAFKNRLNKDINFRNEVDLIRKLSEEVITANDDELKNKIKEWGGHFYDESRDLQKNTFPFWLLILICIILSIIPAIM
ncbi:MAG: hypothetical protein ACEPOW_04190 [Bacteroidales bacterium]